jgi:hypothetical protein
MMLNSDGLFDHLILITDHIVSHTALVAAQLGIEPYYIPTEDLLVFATFHMLDSLKLQHTVSKVLLYLCHPFNQFDQHDHSLCLKNSLAIHRRK